VKRVRSDRKEAALSDVLTSPPTQILTSGHPGWDNARRAWNLTVDQHPVAVALPNCAQDVVDAIRFARVHGMRVAAAGTARLAACDPAAFNATTRSPTARPSTPPPTSLTVPALR
jgi:hypothetical protein